MGARKGRRALARSAPESVVVAAGIGDEMTTALGSRRPGRLLLRRFLHLFWMPRSVGDYLVIACVIVSGAAVLLCWGLLPLGLDDWATTVVLDVLNPLAQVPLFLLILPLVRSANRGRIERVGWVLLALAYVSNILADCAALTFEYQMLAPYPSIADIGYVAFYPLAFGGIVALSRARTSRFEGLRLLLDVATVVIAAAICVWSFLLAPAIGGEALGPVETLLGIAYPTGSMLLLFGVSVAWLKNPANANRAWLPLLAIGLGWFFIADAGYAYLQRDGSYNAVSWPRAAYVVSYAFVAWGVRYAARSRGTASVANEEVVRPGFSLLPYIGAAVGYTFVIVNLGSTDPTVAAGGGILTAVVFGRQILAAREHARMSAAMASGRSEARFRSLVQHSSDAIVVVANSGRVTFATPSADLLFAREGGLIGQHILDTAWPESRPAFAQFLGDAVTAGSEVLQREVAVGAEGRSLKWLEVRATNLLDDPNVRGIVLNGRDVTARKDLEAQLTTLALTDVLTGLPNRALFHDRVSAALRRANWMRSPVSVMILDLDNFKVVNDTLGHPTGDRLLATVAVRLTATLGEGDTVARLGGDEFGILLEGRAATEDAQQLADRIRSSIAGPIVLEGREIFVSASIGVAPGSPAATVESIIRDADLAMYSAKSREKGSQVVFVPNMRDRMAAELALTMDLHRALEENEFLLDYQPIVQLVDGAISGAEALLRWAHPGRGIIPPLEFVPAAEASRLIVPIGQWVMAEACRTSITWENSSSSQPILGVAVNLSVRQLRTGFVSEVERILRETEIEPGTLTLEIVESFFLNNSSHIDMLAEVRRLGVRIAIDDFGTGYSSLSYLGRLPVDIVKVAGEFVVRLDSQPEAARSVLRAILELAEANGLSTIAEGIETAEQLKMLVDLGYRYGQGYYLARPPARDEFTRLVMVPVRGKLLGGSSGLSDRTAVA